MDGPDAVDAALLAEAGDVGISGEQVPDVLRPGRANEEGDARSLRCPVCGADPLSLVLVWFSVGAHIFSSQDGPFMLSSPPTDEPADAHAAAMEAILECPEGHQAVLNIGTTVPPHGVTLTPSSTGRTPPGRL